MTENEAIGWIKRIYIDTNQSDKCIALKMAISALSDVQKYRAANCEGCKNDKSDECMHCMRAYSDCYESKGAYNMEKCLDGNKGAMLTGTAIQDDETFKAEGGFIPERDQYYFQMQQGSNIFLVGFKDLLTCLRLLEKMGEIPEISNKWWLRMAALYGNDILMVAFKEEEISK